MRKSSAKSEGAQFYLSGFAISPASLLAKFVVCACFLDLSPSLTTTTSFTLLLRQRTNAPTHLVGTMSKSPITCHVLDSTLGKPAANVRVQLEALSPSTSQFKVLATGATNSDGRCPDLLTGQKAEDVLTPKGIYKMTFYTGEYFEQASRATFYPQVEVSSSRSEADKALTRLKEGQRTDSSCCFVLLDLVPAHGESGSALPHSLVAIAVLVHHLPWILVSLRCNQNVLYNTQKAVQHT